MPIRFFIVSIMLPYFVLFSQKVINYEIPAQGNIYLTPDITIPKVNKGYTVWLPNEEKIKGLIVFIRSRRDTNHTDQLIDYALTKKLAVMFATTENTTEFFFDNVQMLEIEEYIFAVLSNHRIPSINLFFCGMSLEGTRALRLAAYSQSKVSRYKLTPKAIAVCDSPLDMIRFHKLMVKAKSQNLLFPGKTTVSWASTYLEQHFGGTPADVGKAYIDYSPFCHEAGGGVNLKYFKDIAIRAYTEPDIQWWMSVRKKDYYAMNAVDLAGLINEVRILGNHQAELIVTHNKGFNTDGTKQPHSWSIVDEIELVDWFVKQLK